MSWLLFLDFVPKGYKDIDIIKLEEMYGNLDMEKKQAKIEFLEELRK